MLNKILIMIVIRVLFEQSCAGYVYRKERKIQEGQKSFSFHVKNGRIV